jgi:hypothetical protein
MEYLGDFEDERPALADSAVIRVAAVVLRGPGRALDAGGGVHGNAGSHHRRSRLSREGD